MNDSPSDEIRLGSTETHMRRALGLDGDTPRQSTTGHSTATTNGSHPQRRRFVRDGEVPVTVINRDHRQDDNSGANQLDAARQAIRSQAAARERAELSVAEAQATIRSLQTTLAHECLAKDEAIQRAVAEKQALQAVRSELAAERQARQRAEDALRDAQATISSLTEKLHGAQQALHTAQAELATERRARQNAERVGKMPVEAHEVAAPANRIEAIPRVRRPVGRPRKTVVMQPVEKPVEPSANAPGRPVTVKVKGSAKTDRVAQRPAGKPVKWWLTA